MVPKLTLAIFHLTGVKWNIGHGPTRKLTILLSVFGLLRCF